MYNRNGNSPVTRAGYRNKKRMLRYSVCISSLDNVIRAMSVAHKAGVPDA